MALRGKGECHPNYEPETDFMVKGEVRRPVPVYSLIPFPDLLIENRQKIVEVVNTFGKDRPTSDSPWFQQKPDYAPNAGLAAIIVKEIGKRIHTLIADEAHEYKSDSSAQGIAFSRIAEKARKIVALTATPNNGRADSAIQLEYAINPTRMNDHFGHNGSSTAMWVARMGITEEFFTNAEVLDYGKRTVKMTKTSPKVGIGATPAQLIWGLDHFIYVGLEDMSAEMPTMEDIVIPVMVNHEIAVEYDKAVSWYESYANDRKKRLGDVSAQAKLNHFKAEWLNAFWKPYNFTHNFREEKGGEVIRTEVKTPYSPKVINTISNKEQKLLEIVYDELAEGRKVTVYTNTSGHTAHIAELIRNEVTPNVVELHIDTCKTNEREAWFKRQMAEGAEVLVTNMDLVKTGIDLVETPTIIFFEHSPNIFTVLQARGRAWRAIQTEPCKAYYLINSIDGETIDNPEAALLYFNIARKMDTVRFLTGKGEHGAIQATGVRKSLDEELAEIIAENVDLNKIAQAFKNARTESDWISDDEPQLIEVAAPVQAAPKVDKVVMPRKIEEEMLPYTAPVQLSLF
ncbi:MAG: hypothetical protein HC892_00075 [Saprospiraceae bacterium]|nr:hypothetical protein [Saprospiraceae bacterium]